MGGEVNGRFYATAVRAATVFLDRDASISRLEEWVVKAKAACATSSGGTSGLFDNPVTVALSGTVNNCTPVRWVPGITNAPNITPTGTPTVNGINTLAMGSGFSVLVYNTSTTLSVSFANLASGSLSVHQIACLQAITVALGPQAGTIMTFNGTNLIFGG